MSSAVVVIGSSNTDVMVRTDRLPRRGETVVGKDIEYLSGGKGANQAVAACRAGGDVTFVGCVGDDAYGQRAVQELNAAGICTKWVRRHRRLSSGMAMIVVDSQGENMITVLPGANAALSPEDVDRARSAIRSADIVVLQLEIPLRTVIQAIRVAKQHGKLVLLNPAPAARLGKSVLRGVDYLTPNEHERKLLGDLSGYSGSIVETRGLRGVRVRGSGANWNFPAFPVKAVDTVGAGDCFSGVLSTALAEQQPLVDAVRLACGAAALCVTQPGAQPAMPTRRQIESFLKRQPPTSIPATNSRKGAIR